MATLDEGEELKSWSGLFLELTERGHQEIIPVVVFQCLELIKSTEFVWRYSPSCGDFIFHSGIVERVSVQHHLGYLLCKVADLHLLGVYLRLSTCRQRQNQEIMNIMTLFILSVGLFEIMCKDTLLKAKKTDSIKNSAIFVD